MKKDQEALAGSPDGEHELPPTPEACAARCDPDLTLTVTTGVFEFARKLSGVLVIMIELVRSQRLFERAGYETMQLYVAEKLGITSRNSRKRMYSAGRAAWRIYPDLCQEVVSALQSADRNVVPTLPEVPSQSALALLPRALEHSSDPANLAQQVRDRAITVATLTRIARPSSKHPKPPNKNRASNRSTMVTSLRLPHDLRDRLRARAEHLGIGYTTLAKRAVELGLDAAVRTSGGATARRGRR